MLTGYKAYLLRCPHRHIYFHRHHFRHHFPRQLREREGDTRSEICNDVTFNLPMSSSGRKVKNVNEEVKYVMP